MSLSPPVVLIVSDDDESAAMYAFGLLAIGFQPVVAPAGDDPVLLARRCRPDAVVADIASPHDAASVLTRRLRADAITSDAAILIVTKDDRRAIEESAFAAGCDRILLKPCYPDALALAIQSAWDVRQSLPPGES